MITINFFRKKMSGKKTTTKRFRVCFKNIDTQECGEGPWHEDEKLVAESVTILNREHGRIHHWKETEIIPTLTDQQKTGG